MSYGLFFYKFGLNIFTQEIPFLTSPPRKRAIVENPQKQESKSANLANLWNFIHPCGCDLFPGCADHRLWPGSGGRCGYGSYPDCLWPDYGGRLDYDSDPGYGGRLDCGLDLCFFYRDLYKKTN